MDDQSLLISELFYSIQGESTWAGLPCAFIRLAGCNLRCSYCDSGYTWEETGRVMNFEQIHDWLDRYPSVMTELTGGEPLLQENIYPFADSLLTQGRKVLMETNGSIGLDRVPYEVSVIMDIKCPGSGVAAQNNWNNIDILRQRKRNGSHDEIKFVLSSEDDFYWACDIVRQNVLAKTLPVLFSPVEDKLSPAKLAERLMEEMIPARMQLQLHRILWPDARRGV